MTTDTRDILLTEAVRDPARRHLTGGVAQSTPYIGQPAYKRMGSRAGYTLLTGIVIGLGGMLGAVSFIVELIPRAVLRPILFVALDLVSVVPGQSRPACARSRFRLLPDDRAPAGDQVRESGYRPGGEFFAI